MIITATTMICISRVTGEVAMMRIERDLILFRAWLSSEQLASALDADPAWWDCVEEQYQLDPPEVWVESAWRRVKSDCDTV